MSDDIRATIKLYNYRCFDDKNPGVLEIRPGFSAFVGTNNSGKSTLLRAIRELTQLFGLLRDSDSLVKLARQEPSGFAYQDTEDTEEIFYDQNDGPIVVEILCPTGKEDELSVLRLEASRQTKGWTATFATGASASAITTSDVRQYGPTFVNSAGGRQAVSFDNMRALGSLLGSTVYIPAFRHAISGATGTVAGDLLLGADFLNTWAAWQTGSVKWQRQKILQIVEDIRAMFGFDQLVVQPAAGNATLQVLINGKDYRLRELGAGLTQFLLVLATVAIKKPKIVLIDEPELNLHPTLQQEFLTAIAGYSGYGVMFATHSLGLARSAADHLYAVRRIGTCSSVHAWETAPSVAELLGELNYSTYRETGQARVLCVEGLHDVRPVQQLLRLLRAESSTLVVQGGGDQLCTDAGVAMIADLQRLAQHVYVLLDSERTSVGGEPKASRTWFAAAAAGIGVRVHLTDRRALENYLPEAAVQRVFGPGIHALTEFEGHDGRWPKRENWRIAREIQATEIEDNDLIQFIREVISQ
jgi:ABC-type cobalamin/Fe3+-siderophores transport system ATPase subunit